MSEMTPEHAHVVQLMNKKIAESPIYAFLLTSMKTISAKSGTVVTRMLLEHCHMNSKGSLHGSVIATIVDFLGGMAIATVDMRENTGVSVDIHVTYQSGAKVGEEIEMEAIAEKVGASLAFTRLNISAVAGDSRGRLIATGTHTKFVRGTAVATS